MKQLSEFNNPFLLKALEDYLPPELLKKDNVDDVGVSEIQNIQIETNIFKRYFYYILQTYFLAKHFLNI